jgi:peptidoglycan hydrolase CwlO-like protein
MSGHSTSNQNVAPLPTNGHHFSNLMQELQANHEQLERTVAALREQIAVLEAERNQLRHERDDYREQFYNLAEKYLPEAPPELSITKEEIEEAIASGRDFGDLIRKLESA